MSGYLIVDSHLDLAFNAVQLKRDLTLEIAAVRAHDPESIVRSFGTCTVTLPELRRGRVGLVFGTILTRVDPNDCWTLTGMYSQSQCYAVGRGHLAWYQALERQGLLRFVRTTRDLEEVAASWGEGAPEGDAAGQSGGGQAAPGEAPPGPGPAVRPGAAADPPPIGLVLAMEGADAIMDPDQVSEWHELGLRMVSLSHFGTGVYAHGTGSEGGLLPAARPLLEALKTAGIVVDLTHLADRAFWELLHVYDGPVAASHQNCRALVPGQRQLSDEMIHAVIERDGVIGVALDSWMLDPHWRREVAACDQVSQATLETVAGHIDRICQLAGDAGHAGIGSDLDGGFGQEQGPRDLDTAADLGRLGPIMEKRGYSEADVRRILSGNWIDLLRRVWGR